MKQLVVEYAIYFVRVLTDILSWAILISIVLSWVGGRRRSPFRVWVDSVVRPILKPFRWARIGMMDFSPIAAILVIDFGGRFIIQVLSKLLEL